MAEVYRGFDQAALDREYNAAAAVPHVQQYFASWRERSTSARQRLRCAIDVLYGASPAESLDIFFSPKNDAPVQIFFHGGYWRAQDKANFSFLAEPFVKEGATVLVANYGLCPGVTIDEIAQQCRNCVAWAYKNAKIFGADPHSIYVYGHSAGGQIVAHLLGANWSAEGVPEDVIKGAVGISGVYDLEPIRLSFLNADLRLDPAQALRNSPRYQIPRRRAPFVLAVGAEETSEFLRQTAEYAAVLNDRSYAATHMIIPGFNHYDILDAAADLSHPLGRALAMQLFDRQSR